MFKSKFVRSVQRVEACAPRLGKAAVPLIVAGAVVCAAGLAAVGSEAQPKKIPDQVLLSKDGIKFVARFEGRRVRALVAKGRSTMPPADGVYELTNGGAIKIEGGWIVWDAFGVIERLKDQGIFAAPAALG